MFNFDKYVGNHKWVKTNSIYVCRHGSMAYGTNGPDSDEDIRGVFIAPKEYYLGFSKKMAQIEGGWDQIDATLFNITRFFELAVDCNPNVLELLFIDESDWLHVTPFWKAIVEHRDLFLSQNVKHRFCGYAVSQLKRIESHRRWLLNPPTHKPTRKEYGLPDETVIPKEQREALDAMMKKIIDGWQVDLSGLADGDRIDLLNKLSATLTDMKLSADDQYVAAGNKLGLSMQAMEFLKSERAYRCAIAEWGQYETWKRDRNPARAALEAKYGADTKHLMHLVRLLKMCKEIVEGKGVIVKRPDAEELKAIRFDGAWTYEQARDWSIKQRDEIEEAMKTTQLPKYPNKEKLDELCIDMLTEFFDVRSWWEPHLRVKNSYKEKK